jgi:lipopolysaccharide/colanic/teichoic acid biosynthesis glycosyltransferase
MTHSSARGDLLVACFVLVLTAPVQSAVACSVRATERAPVYLDRYTPEQSRRHEVRPGLAQVSGRNAPTWDAKFPLDVEYLDHRSRRVDLWILARTLRGVLRREGIAATARRRCRSSKDPRPPRRVHEPARSPHAAGALLEQASRKEPASA